MNGFDVVAAPVEHVRRKYSAWYFGGRAGGLLRPTWFGASALLGLATAFVYPTLLAVVADVAHPTWRGSAVGVYRLWRDSGYAAGALLAGLVADLFGIRAAIVAVGLIALGCCAQVAGRMPRRSRSTGRRRRRLNVDR
jgi:MFS family permease